MDSAEHMGSFENEESTNAPIEKTHRAPTASRASNPSLDLSLKKLESYSAEARAFYNSYFAGKIRSDNTISLKNRETFAPALAKQKDIPVQLVNDALDILKIIRSI